ncbi:hypothetical protein B0A50_00740 [Salinomyces thailandicus]|uniref:Uncharacterized protein n=1 Tax=Salinomyces thailandicus TaxID=706561 RepID=A0A4U0UD62_9PEZI|nr:hypothetical protein B0A50_00740 [Salinomyces thailandica]
MPRLTGFTAINAPRPQFTPPGARPATETGFAQDPSPSPATRRPLDTEELGRHGQGSAVGSHKGSEGSNVAVAGGPRGPRGRPPDPRGVPGRQPSRGGSAPRMTDRQRAVAAAAAYRQGHRPEGEGLITSVVQMEREAANAAASAQLQREAMAAGATASPRQSPTTFGPPSSSAPSPPPASPTPAGRPLGSREPYPSNTATQSSIRHAERRAEGAFCPRLESDERMLPSDCGDLDLMVDWPTHALPQAPERPTYRVCRPCLKWLASFEGVTAEMLLRQVDSFRCVYDRGLGAACQRCRSRHLRCKENSALPSVANSGVNVLGYYLELLRIVLQCHPYDSPRITELRRLIVDYAVALGAEVALYEQRLERKSRRYYGNLQSDFVRSSREAEEFQRQQNAAVRGGAVRERGYHPLAEQFPRNVPTGLEDAVVQALSSRRQ